ncbi:MAG: twin-arginine translocase TatA/TatE family subunit [Flavobacteriaceae bacterium]|nr:twin-arginine translocase TatA/TatE family subunit [Flavobacteriaceae bacterium]MCY4253614.1 twin-arginine translocase TatA/TatE family subunit [Flavobacteriaceae bacterium]
MVYFISGPEIIFIFFIFLLVFGADKIPGLARTLAKGMTQVRQATNEIKTELQKSVDDNLENPTQSVTKDIKQKVGNISKEFKDIEDSVKRDFTKQNSS